MLVRFGPENLRYPDAMEYADMARGLARGDGLLDRAEWIYQLSFSDKIPAPAVRRATLFPVVEAAMFRLFGASDRTAHGSSALFFFFSLILTWTLCNRACEERARAAALAWIAGILVLFDSESLTLAVSGLSEPMFTCAILLIALVLVREPFSAQWLLIGFLAGASQWIRLNGFALIIPCLMAAWILDPRALWRNVFWALSGCAIPLLALAVRNFQTSGKFSFVGPNGAIIFNETGGLTEHGIERRLFLPPEAPPSLLSLFTDRWSDFARKVWFGSDRNFLSALVSASPLAWGGTAIWAAARWRSIGRRVRALVALTFGSMIVWITLFSTGEFEGPRFFVPLAPLAITLGILAYRDLYSPPESSGGFNATNGEPRRSTLKLSLLIPCVALLFPGVHRLSEMIRAELPDPFPQLIGPILARQTQKDAIILSDAPWAVAWYGDRASLWIPQSIEETARVISRSGATHLLLSPAIASETEIEERWKRIYFNRRDQPPEWKPISMGPLEKSAALFDLRR